MTAPGLLNPQQDRRFAFGFGATVGGLVLLITGFHLLTLQGGVGWWGDTYQYVLHAQNIVEGKAYADTGYIQNPERYIAPIAYPAGFPFLLALVLAISGMSAQAILILQTLVWAGTLTALAYLFKHVLPRPYVYGLVLVIGLQPYVWALKHIPLADLTFLLASVLSLLCYDRALRARSAEAGPNRWGVYAVLAGVMAAYAIGTRPQGLVLLPCFLVCDLVRVRWPTRLFVIASLSCLLLYGAYTALVDLQAGARIARLGDPADGVAAGAGGGYWTLVRIAILERLGDLPQHVAARLADYARATFVFWHVPQPGGDVVKHILMGLSLVPVGLGLVHRLRREFGVIEAFSLLYFLSLLPWPFSDQRYFAPLIPFYYFYLFVGLDRFRVMRGEATDRLARSAMVVVFIAIASVYALRYTPVLLAGDTRPGLAELAADPVYVYLRENTPSSAVIITSGDPRRSVFFSRRAGSAAPRDLERWPAFAEGIGATYALVGGSVRQEAERHLSSSDFRLVVSSDAHELYRFVVPSAE